MAEGQKSILNEYYEFKPVEEVTTEELVSILTALKLTFHEAGFQRLSEEAKRHFIVNTRAGGSHRYGKEPKPMKDKKEAVAKPAAPPVEAAPVAPVQKKPGGARPLNAR